MQKPLRTERLPRRTIAPAEAVLDEKGLSTEERRDRVAALYRDSSLPLEQRSSRALGVRFEVSHRTILNDLVAREVTERHEKPSAGGISKQERQRIVRELFPTHTRQQIADAIGCSVGPVKKDIAQLGLRHPKRSAKTHAPWADYLASRRVPVEKTLADALPLYESGMTLDEIESERPDLPRHRVHYAMTVHGISRRASWRRPIHRSGRLVKCAAREKAYCPHGEAERWICTSHLVARRAEFLSRECWARYRAEEEWRSLLPMIRTRFEKWKPGQKPRKWKNRDNASKERSRHYSPEQLDVATRMLNAGKSIRAVAANTGLSKHQVEDIKLELATAALGR